MSDFGIDPATARLILTITLLAGVIGLGLWIIAAWRKQLDDEGPSDEDLLEQFREARDDGEMDDDEYRRVHEVLKRGPARPIDPASFPPSPLRPEAEAEAAKRPARGDEAGESSP